MKRKFLSAATLFFALVSAQALSLAVFSEGVSEEFTEYEKCVFVMDGDADLTNEEWEAFKIEVIETLEQFYLSNPEVLQEQINRAVAADVEAGESLSFRRLP